ncbi:MAG TPA: hypothetical protein VKK79_25025 [Candidatus Lokiarchaeia archaeon]|nr:hypothetical protein [Candidatus Lokiarchaeia archaeon]
MKQASEAFWETISVRTDIYGFQIQPGTTWNPGLSIEEIANYEAEVGFAFPPIYKEYLKVMNGTNTPAINVYGDSGNPPQFAKEYYAYPEDLPQVMDKILWIYDECKISPEEVESQEIPHILPIVSHRFLIVDRCPSNPVLSMYGNDIIPYSRNLMVFLFDDIFNAHAQDTQLPANLRVKFWLE